MPMHSGLKIGYIARYSSMTNSNSPAFYIAALGHTAGDNAARLFGDDVGFHLHRLDDAQRFVNLYRIADLYQHLADQAGDGGCNMPFIRRIGHNG